MIIMLKITDLRIDPHSLGDKFLFSGEITPAYDYKDWHKTNNINGYKYGVVLPNLKFEKINIKVPIEKKPAPLFDILSDEPIPAGIELGFKGLNVGTYFSNGTINITASAEDVFLIDNKKG